MQKINLIRYRKPIFVALLILCLVLSVIGLLLCLSANRQHRTQEADTAAEIRKLAVRIEALEEKSASMREYLLVEHEGKIGIYNSERTVLYEILDVYVKTLPRRDREMLAEGIVVCGEAALRAITEDYSS